MMLIITGEVMIQYDETRLAMEALTPQIEELKGALNLEGIKI